MSETVLLEGTPSAAPSPALRLGHRLAPGPALLQLQDLLLKRLDALADVVPHCGASPVSLHSSADLNTASKSQA